MDIFPYWYAAFGLIIGSFLNVCIYRLPRRDSIVFPGSHCPQCGKAVRAYDNIPVLSWLLLRGRCRFCGERISLQYPLVELLTGIGFYTCVSQWGATAPTFVNSLFLSIILVLIFTDYHHQILPNALTLPGAGFGILLCAFQAPSLLRDPGDLLASYVAGLVFAPNPDAVLPWVSSLLGVLAGGGMLLAVALAYQAVRKRQGLGMGDVKMMAMVGAFLGWRLAVLTIFLGSFLGGIIGVMLIAFGGRTMQSKLAFGTFLGAAAILFLFFGPAFLQWYMPA